MVLSFMMRAFWLFLSWGTYKDSLIPLEQHLLPSWAIDVPLEPVNQQCTPGIPFVLKQESFRGDARSATFLYEHRLPFRLHSGSVFPDTLEDSLAGPSRDLRKEGINVTALCSHRYPSKCTLSSCLGFRRPVWKSVMSKGLLLYWLYYF